MLGSKKPIVFKEQRLNLKSKHTIVRDHFLCAEILRVSGYDSIHDYIRAATITFDEEGYESVTFPKVKSGSVSRAAKHHGISRDVAYRIWHLCLRIENWRNTVYENDHRRGQSNGLLSSEERRDNQENG